MASADMLLSNTLFEHLIQNGEHTYTLIPKALTSLHQINDGFFEPHSNFVEPFARRLYIRHSTYLTKYCRSKIIITSRKQPMTYWVDPRVEFIALDFLESPEVLVNKIKAICKDVTHAYFTSYIHNVDFSKLAGKNCPLFRNFLEAVDAACPKLERVCLQTGGKVSLRDQM